MSATLSGIRVFADVIKMRSYWITVGANVTRIHGTQEHGTGYREPAGHNALVYGRELVSGAPEQTGEGVG